MIMTLPESDNRVASMPVMKNKCATCPFGDTDRGWRDVNLAVAVTERTLFKGQQIS